LINIVEDIICPYYKNVFAHPYPTYVVGVTLSVSDRDTDHFFIGLKIWVLSTALCGKPYSLALARYRLGSLHVSEDNVTIKATIFVHKFCWGIETSTTT
jgi:hypothetical protein